MSGNHGRPFTCACRTTGRSACADGCTEKPGIMNRRSGLILSKLDIHHLDQPVETLSGGQAKRVALAKMLIQEPDLLILDEPTNHLDVAMIEWLEGISAPRYDHAGGYARPVFFWTVCAIRSSNWKTESSLTTPAISLIFWRRHIARLWNRRTGQGQKPVPA